MKKASLLKGSILSHEFQNMLAAKQERYRYTIPNLAKYIESKGYYYPFSIFDLYNSTMHQNNWRKTSNDYIFANTNTTIDFV